MSKGMNKEKTVFDFTVNGLYGESLALESLAGRVLLIVNTASKCGFTPQYKELEDLHRRYHDQGLTILAFPCNQFGHQEPGDAATIGQFCTINYAASFTLCEKVEVNGPNAAPLFKHLKAQKTGILGSRSIKWNFTKFLVDRTGKVLKRYGSITKPSALKRDIEAALAESL